jgi:hypothetical protein
MPEERYRNIFDAASKKLGKKKVGKPVPPPATSIHTTTSYVKINPPALSPKSLDPEIQRMIQRMKEMSNEVEQKVETLLNKGKLTREQLMRYLNNPKNFSPEQWKKAKQTREFLSSKTFGEGEFKIETPSQANKTNQANMKDRKSKTLGNRKKWIPIK